MRRLEGKTAFITGCNRGIGRAAVERFIREGANVYCALRKPNADFEQWATERAKENNVNASFVYFDLSDEEQTKVALKDLAKTKPQIDILINNAGMADGMLMLMTPAKRMKEVFQVNFFSQVIVTQHIAKIMMKHKKAPSSTCVLWLDLIITEEFFSMVRARQPWHSSHVSAPTSFLLLASVAMV